MENVDKGKRFLIIGVVVAAAILIFTAVFIYFSSKEMAEMEEQLSQLNEDYKIALKETNEYASSTSDKEAVAVIADVTEKGNKVATIENKMIKFTFENMNPIDAPSEDSRIDKKTRNTLKSLFSKDDASYMESPWAMGKDLHCTFNPIFQYSGGKMPVMWLFEQDGRVAAIAVASYNPTKSVFEDLEIYQTMYGNDVSEEASDLMVERATGTKLEDNEFDGIDIVDESEEPEGTMLLDDDGAEWQDNPETNTESTTNDNTSKEGE